MKYEVLLERTDEGVSISVPGLPGSWSQGTTEAEALANITSAIREHMEAREELNRGPDLREVDVTA